MHGQETLTSTSGPCWSWVPWLLLSASAAATQSALSQINNTKKNKLNLKNPNPQHWSSPLCGRQQGQHCVQARARMGGAPFPCLLTVRVSFAEGLRLLQGLGRATNGLVR